MFERITPVVKNLIIINVLILLAQTYLQGSGFNDIEWMFQGHYVLGDNFYPWQVVTYMFMHGGFGHLLSNMFGLFFFGSSLERVWGGKRFLQFYLLSGIGSFLIYELFIGIGVAYFNMPEVGLTIPVVGASGAIFALLMGIAMLFPNSEIRLLFFPVPIKAKYFVLLYGLYELTQVPAGDGVAHTAHLGGLLVGFIIIKYWQKSRTNFY